MARDDLQYHSNIQESDTAMKPWHPKHMWRTRPQLNFDLANDVAKVLDFTVPAGVVSFWDELYRFQI